MVTGAETTKSERKTLSTCLRWTTKQIVKGTGECANVAQEERGGECLGEWDTERSARTPSEVRYPCRDCQIRMWERARKDTTLPSTFQLRHAAPDCVTSVMSQTHLIDQIYLSSFMIDLKHAIHTYFDEPATCPRLRSQTRVWNQDQEGIVSEPPSSNSLSG